MKRLTKNKKIIFCLALLGVLSVNSTVLALQVTWPDSPAGTSLEDESTLPILIQYLYEWGIALGGLAAFIALLIAGVQYLTSFGDPASMKDAMDRIKSAFFGLILLLASWLILNTINPDLTTFRPLVIELPKENLGVCKTDEECKEFGDYYKCTETKFEGKCESNNECIERHGNDYECVENSCKSIDKFCVVDFESQFKVSPCTLVTIDEFTMTVEGKGYDNINIDAGESFTITSSPDKCMGYLELYPGNWFSDCGGDKQTIFLRGGTIQKEEAPEDMDIDCVKLKAIDTGF